MTEGQIAYIALGSNVANATKEPIFLVKSAIEAIDHNLTSICATSQFYRSAAYPPGAGPDFVNAVIALRSTASPQQILAQLHEIESQFGRERPYRWAPRSLDLDLLALGDAILPDAQTNAWWRMLPPDRQERETPDQLILPHPRLHERAFVLAPLADIAPDWRHPALGLTTTQMLARLPAGAVQEMQIIS